VKRDELSRLEVALRGANPVPWPDDLIDSEESAAVALLVEHRKTTPPTTSTGPSLRPIPQPHRSPSRGWAFAAGFIVMIVLVGVAALFVRGGDTPVADDQTVTTSAVTDPEVPTTRATDEPAPSADAVTELSAGDWQEVAVGQPWVTQIVDIAALPNGGFVAVTSERSPWSVVWSPDGAEWRNGDPLRQVPQSSSTGLFDPLLVAVTADRVVVIDKEDVGVWVGDPERGQWEPTSLDTHGADGDLAPIAVASNDGEVLVVAKTMVPAATEDNGESSEAPPMITFVVWLVDTTEGTSVQAPLPVTTTFEWDWTQPLVEWFAGRWVVMVPQGDGTNSLWQSSDGASWSEVALPDSLNEFPGTSLTVGPSGLIVTRSFMGGDEIWHSADAIDWNLVFDRGFVTKSTYSEALGYVVEVSGDIVPEPIEGGVLVSSDGEVWLLAGPAPSSFGMDVLLAASDNKLLVRGDALEEESLWLWTSG